MEKWEWSWSWSLKPKLNVKRSLLRRCVSHFMYFCVGIRTGHKWNQKYSFLHITSRPTQYSNRKPELNSSINTFTLGPTSIPTKLCCKLCKSHWSPTQSVQRSTKEWNLPKNVYTFGRSKPTLRLVLGNLTLTDVTLCRSIDKLYRCGDRWNDNSF